MEKRQRRFAVFDIDGTLIRWQLYHAIFDALAKLDYVSAQDYQAIHTARTAWKQRQAGASFKNYEEELVKTYLANLPKISPAQLDKAIDSVFNEYKDQVYTYTRDLIKHLKEQGYLIFAISGSHADIVAKVAAHYGFDDFIGSVFLKKNDKFTGQVTSAYGSKDLSLKRLAKRHTVTFKDSFAVGDSLSDSKMMDLVQNPIAFNPDADLLAHARGKGWKIVVERKNVIYELEADGSTYVLA